MQPGSTAVVVGDGAVGLMGVLAAKQMGAGRIIAISATRPGRISRWICATDIISERGNDGVARVQVDGGVGADSALECVGAPELMAQAMRCARPGGTIG